ncbi:chromate efflux transporter [Leucobacter sp. cx-42]|uniref:chromate efflux transporter n=1 Tax=unclassified Leucobacter TaxID=2621730 RepID=UPI00165E11AA|nr:MULTISPECIES: chromate efflux transporter [unclassified Leucobacter]MBC9953829.1 chromate efflux transporter [Leucobacter sp. cx-42]
MRDVRAVWEVFRVFLKLGLTSFGGPAAHLGYFRTEFVDRKRWLTDEQYADLVALCQFLPGPASSQVGFAIGLQRAGFGGAIAAFLGFTLPSAAVLVAFAYGANMFGGSVGAGLLLGLKAVAVAVVTHAVVGMARTLTPDLQRVGIALGVAVLSVLGLFGVPGQALLIALGALAGLLLCRNAPATVVAPVATRISRRGGAWALAIFGGVLAGGAVVAVVAPRTTYALFGEFYRAGALVFGGGHTVLPLLQAGVVDSGWVSAQDFLAGYGATQAMPGPLFTFAGFLGAVSSVGPGGVLGAVIALVAVFLPGMLLLIGVLPFWTRVRSNERAQRAMRGANAAVVGIMAAALIYPIVPAGITSIGTLVLAVGCLVLLLTTKASPWIVVILGAVGGVAVSLLSGA